jgi:multimeric flavodoxin WrbA
MAFHEQEAPIMNILCILGSPRKNGNSATIAQHFLSEAKDRGARIDTYRLNTLDYKACQACYACKTRLDHCALEDELTPVLAVFCQCDLAVIATPVYFGDISAQTKAFIDRTFSLVNPDFQQRPDPVRFAPGKKMLWIITQEAPESFHDDIFQRYGGMFNTYAGVESHLIRGTSVEAAGEVIHNQAVMARATEMARRLISEV